MWYSKKSMNKKIMYAAAALVVLGAAGFAVKMKYAPTQSSGPDNEVLLAKSAELNAGLPAEIDSETRLDATAVSGNTFTSKFTLVNNQKEDVDVQAAKDILTPMIRNGVCTNEELAVFRTQNAVMVYSYYDMDGDFVLSIEVDTTTCSE